jgi:hypothetical protein
MNLSRIRILEKHNDVMKIEQSAQRAGKSERHGADQIQGMKIQGHQGEIQET